MQQFKETGVLINETKTIAKIRWRLVTLLMLSYFAAYLDRVNLSFAALSMNHELGFSASVFGAGAGIFFLGYVLFEVPSNLALSRFGARRWFARIMLTWGVISLLFVFVRSVPGFFGLRFLLGAAEAGFYPGVILVLTRWFPVSYRARMVGFFSMALPVSAAIGAPLSGLILNLHGLAGLSGWQWLFIIEALPSFVMSVVLLRTLADSPEKAGWLSDQERKWLTQKLSEERKSLPQSGEHRGVARALRNPLVWLFGFVYAGIVAANYGVSFFLPQIVRAFGLSVSMVGVISALPSVAGAIGLLWWGARSDRLHERRWHLLIPGIIVVLALVVVASTDYPPVRLAALIVCGFGAFANVPVFWTLPPSVISDSEVPAGIAVISSIGNVAGFAAPYAVGALKELTGTFATGMLALAIFIALTICVGAIISRPRTATRGMIGEATP
ncbi:MULTISPECIES: MFS transporter [Paraburkholderia]|uniref:MFS transporter n=1 Tax=Paraburkholderia TaxID=1822464 RepID=UPI001FC94B96|nr:MFS transporter [Paraburkholderia aspalathi]